MFSDRTTKNPRKNLRSPDDSLDIHKSMSYEFMMNSIPNSIPTSPPNLTPQASVIMNQQSLAQSTVEMAMIKLRG